MRYRLLLLREWWLRLRGAPPVRMDLSDFDRYCDAHDVTDDEVPHAFAAWLSAKTGWDGQYRRTP